MNIKIAVLCVLFSSVVSCDHGLAHYRVDFHESMKISCEHDRVFAQKDYQWKIAERLYNQYILDDLQFSEQPLIPLIVHHIWLGSMLPEYAKEFRKTWIKYNPDWTFILWTDYPSPEFGKVVLHSFEALKAYLAQPDHEQFVVMNMRSVTLQNQDAFNNRARNYGEKSDIARYEILNEIGGLYVDTDFECLRSFDDFHHCCAFYTGISHTKEFVLYNGLIGSAAQNSILQETIDLLDRRVNKGDSLRYSGPHYFTDCFIRKVPTFNGRAIAFPVTFLYPWPHHNRSQTYNQARSWIAPESFALHYWKVSWAK